MDDPVINPAAGNMGSGGGMQPPMGNSSGNMSGGMMPPPPPPAQPTPPVPQPQFTGPFTTNIKLPEHPTTTFNELYFLELLAGSISLTIDEKKKIIEAVPKLSQYQIDELMKIFEEEKSKFAELAEKHADQINKLKAQHRSEWEMLELETKQTGQKQEDQSKADEIRKQLGL